MNYDFKNIENKWQNIWKENETFKCKENSKFPKWYGLIEFPYPSAAGLHVGHPRSYTALDIVARKRRMQGYNVLYPIGWDAFGLPTENFAIKNKIHPQKVTDDNVANFTKQLKSIGFSFDWSKEVNTTDPNYYKWTQWIFIQMFKKGLAYKSTMPINFCTGCKVGLANEEVVGGVCERCGSDVVQKEKSQWMLKITEYAERLLIDLDDVNYLDKIKAQQINWIGKSEGAEVTFKINDNNHSLKVYTTRPDTIFGATYMVISPEHPILNELKNNISNYSQLLEYKEISAHKSDFERTELNKVKTGVEIIGVKAINPLSNKEIPIWISDYVLMSYGTGAIMSVPAHDERDHEFATKFKLPILEVVKSDVDVQKTPYTNTTTGIMLNSGFLNGLEVTEAIKETIKYVEKEKIGTPKINYKLRDWVFSRQRYWGEPIPIVYCKDCGWVNIPETELPLVLPKIENFEPGENGESPLAKETDWINTTCPKCNRHAKRETDTMPQWAGSSWYFLRYIDPNNTKELASKEKLKYWTPIDWYNGGMEHTTLHLLYSRFWHKFLFDIGVVPTKEPYAKRTSHGMILGTDGNKMSKSKGNVVNPDEIINKYGADTLRVYEMFMGPFDQVAAWSTESLIGCYKFLERVWNLQTILIGGDKYSNEFEVLMNKSIKKVTNDIEDMKFNTSIAIFMTMINEFNKAKKINKAEFKTFLELLNPFAPHITEELYEKLNLNKEIAYTSWPAYDKTKTIDNEINLPIQVNGKLRGTITIPIDSEKDFIKQEVHKQENIKKLTADKTIVKEIYVKNKIYNIVIK